MAFPVYTRESDIFISQWHMMSHETQVSALPEVSTNPNGLHLYSLGFLIDKARMRRENKINQLQQKESQHCAVNVFFPFPFLFPVLASKSRR